MFVHGFVVYAFLNSAGMSGLNNAVIQGCLRWIEPYWPATVAVATVVTMLVAIYDDLRAIERGEEKARSAKVWGCRLGYRPLRPLPRHRRHGPRRQPRPRRSLLVYETCKRYLSPENPNSTLAHAPTDPNSGQYTNSHQQTPLSSAMNSPPTEQTRLLFVENNQIDSGPVGLNQTKPNTSQAWIEPSSPVYNPATENPIGPLADERSSSSPYYMQTYSIILGRNSKKSTVEVDLSTLSDGMNISCNHARIFYDFTRRRFALEVLGKNGCLVEGVLHLSGNPPVKLDSQDLL
ncbi:hypothetical protein Tsubulata_028462 [Turnera subulata]|uniref:FHA domain-containing protein n=1 Tax=Turnera subulata TaxID=218843 RepID=A0A9Q0JFL1_9ROSI|nr:hypothetical protein Tsubulata_028462 [Turnera subulata]